MAIERPLPQKPLKKIHFWSPFLRLAQKFPLRHMLPLLGVILFYKLGDALVLSLNSAFLLQYLHFSLTAVGIANKTVGISASIVGAIIGGLILLRLPLFHGLILFGLLQALSNFGFWILSWHAPSMILMTSIIGVDQFCSGLGSVAFLALLMSLCDAEYSITQFAVLSALASLGRIYLGPVSAFLVDHWGWQTFYLWSFIASFPGVVCLWPIKKLLTKPLSFKTTDNVAK